LSIANPVRSIHEPYQIEGAELPPAPVGPIAADGEPGPVFQIAVI
jgi:hypothetical protein